MIRVVVADDHAVVRAGIRALLAREPEVEVVAEAGTAGEAVDQVVRLSPEVLLIDLAMPGLDGLAAISQVRSQVPKTRVLVLSMFATAEHVRAAQRAGADGYVVKGSGLDELVLALRSVARGEKFLDVRSTQLLREPGRTDPALASDLARLSPREREVLALVARGHTNREIAAALGISAKTVDTHRTSLMRKLDAHDAQALTRFAMRHGLVPDE